MSSDPAPLVVAFAALAVSALQFWRTELRGPDVTVLLMDSPAMDIETPSRHGHEIYEATVRQPLVVENIGGHPCALATFQIAEDLIRVTGWGDERMQIEDALGGPWDRPRPLVLDPRVPIIFTAAWSLRVERHPVDGKPLNLRDRISRAGIGEPVRHVHLAYSEAGTTVRRDIRLSMNEEAVREAVKQLVVASEGGEVPGPSAALIGSRWTSRTCQMFRSTKTRPRRAHVMPHQRHHLRTY